MDSFKRIKFPPTSHEKPQRESFKIELSRLRDN